jgi:hypothetical protein
LRPLYQILTSRDFRQLMRWMDDQLRRSEIFIVTVTQKRKAPLGAAYEVVRMRFAPTEPFLDSLFRVLRRSLRRSLMPAAPSVRFSDILLVKDGNRAIRGALSNDRGLHAAIRCYVIDAPAHVRLYAIRQYNVDRMH